MFAKTTKKSILKILIAPDSFKESLTASTVSAAIAEGIRELLPEAQLEILPFSDGGEGAFELFSTLKIGKLIVCKTCDPLGRPLQAPYFGFNDANTAWIELSQASGLALLKPSEQNPLKTSTYGTGLQIKHALEQGYTQLTLGIGGSATNDVALGIFTALGGEIYDANKNSLSPNGAALLKCSALNLKNLNPLLKNVSITVACDVNNPLMGETGAAQTYAAQKGASSQDIIQLESGAQNMAKIIEEETGITITKIPGGGAAGGTASGMYGLFNSKLKPGFDLLSDLTHLEEKIKNADLIITGEGKTDTQSQYGKVPFKLAELAKKHNKTLILFAGSVTATAEALKAAGIKAAYAIKTPSMTLDYAKTNAYALLKDSVKLNLKKHI